MAATTGAGASNGASEANVAFDIDVQCFVAYWTAPHSLTRSDDALRSSTAEGHVAWLRRYRQVHAGGPAITSLRELVADLPLFMRFLDDRLDKSCGTRARDADAFLACLKYVWSPYDNLNPPKEIVLVRNTRSQLQRQYEAELKSRCGLVAPTSRGVRATL